MSDVALDLEFIPTRQKSRAAAVLLGALALLSLQALFASRWSAALAWQPTWGGTYNNARDRSTAQAYVGFQF